MNFLTFPVPLFSVGNIRKGLNTFLLLEEARASNVGLFSCFQCYICMQRRKKKKRGKLDEIEFFFLLSFSSLLGWLVSWLGYFFSRAKDFWLDKRGEGRIGRRDIYSFFLWKGERRGKLVLREERNNEKNRMEVSVAAAAFCMNINVTNKVGVSRRDRQLGGKNLQLRIKPSFKTYTVRICGKRKKVEPTQ